MKIKVFIGICALIIAVLILTRIGYLSERYEDYVMYIALLFTASIVITIVFNLLYYPMQKGKVVLYYIANKDNLIQLGMIKKARIWRSYHGAGVYTTMYNPINFTKKQLDNYGLDTKNDLYVYKLEVPKNIISFPWVALYFEQGCRKIKISGEGLDLNRKDIKIQNPIKIEF